MTDPVLPAPMADHADEVVDTILDLIEAEPDPDLRMTLLRRAYAHDWELERRPRDPAVELDGGAYLVRFGELRQYVVPLVRVAPRRLT